MLALPRMREQLVKFRTEQINGLRGLLAEYGEVMPKGRAGLRRDMPGALERVSERLPGMVVDSLRDQWGRILRTDEEIEVIERRLLLWHRTSKASRRLEAIPGVGVLTATAVVAAMGDPQAFRSGRESPPGWSWCRATSVPAGTFGYGHQQTRRPLSAHLVDPRRARRDHSRQGTLAVAGAATRAPAQQRRQRGAGEQERAHDVGTARSRSPLRWNLGRSLRRSIAEVDFVST